MKRKLLYSLCLAALLTGCSKQPVFVMNYNNFAQKVDYGLPTTLENSGAEWISDSKAIVMESENHMTDEKVKTDAAFLINESTKKVVFGSNVYDRIYPASTTKVLTSLIVLKYGNLDDKVTITQDNAGVTTFGAQLCHLKKGDVVSLRDLLHVMLVYSGNDVCAAIAEHMYGSEEAFTKIMNEEAKALGATDSNFVNPHGLHDPNHYTTAYDMYLIFRECIKYSEFLDFIKDPSFTLTVTQADGLVRNDKFEATNLYLTKEKKAPKGIMVIGGKTGSTSKALDCLVLLSKNEQNETLISAVFHADGKDKLYESMSALLSKE